MYSLCMVGVGNSYDKLSSFKQRLVGTLNSLLSLMSSFHLNECTSFWLLGFLVQYYLCSNWIESLLTQEWHQLVFIYVISQIAYVDYVVGLGILVRLVFIVGFPFIIQLWLLNLVRISGICGASSFISWLRILWFLKLFLNW